LRILKQQCNGPECTREAKFKGLCPSHYRQDYLGKSLTPLREYRHRPQAPEGYAFCNGCELFKPEDGFPKTVSGKPRYKCKQCINEHQRETYREKVG
jgi:hypothetical protein